MKWGSLNSLKVRKNSLNGYVILNLVNFNNKVQYYKLKAWLTYNFCI